MQQAVDTTGTDVNWHLLQQVRCGEVARVLADLDASEACIAAALLYNSLDAGMLTEQQLREAMPVEIADTVCNASKLAGICQVCGVLAVPALLDAIPLIDVLNCSYYKVAWLRQSAYLAATQVAEVPGSMPASR